VNKRDGLVLVGIIFLVGITFVVSNLGSVFDKQDMLLFIVAAISFFVSPVVVVCFVDRPVVSDVFVGSHRNNLVVNRVLCSYKRRLGA